MRRSAAKYLLTACLGVLTCVTSAFAQDTAEPAPEAAPAAAPEAAAPEAAPAPAEPAPPALEEAMAEPMAEPEPMAEEPAMEEEAEAEPSAESKFNHPKVWMRFGTRLQDPDDPEKLGDISMDGEVNLIMGGSVHEKIGWTADFVAKYGSGEMAGSADILDLIAQFQLADPFQIWVGRMLVPTDRSNWSGNWFQAPWNYPGFYPGGFAGGPKQGPNGRNDGMMVWGDIGEGLVKYYVGVYDLHDVNNNPYISARVNVALLEPEPGPYSSSTYYGKDIFSIGLHFETQKDGIAPTLADPLDPMSMVVAEGDDYSMFSADVLFEKDLGDSGVIDLEGAFHKHLSDRGALKQHMWFLASYLIPGEIGWGRLQPLVRVQLAQTQAEIAGEDGLLLIDAQIGYVIDAYNARMALGYQTGEVLGAKSNHVFLGIQLMQ